MSDSSDYYSYGSTDDESSYSSSSYSVRGKYGKRFTKEEDKLLKELAKDKRNKTWKDIAEYLPGRTARQCRDRYNQYLFKDVVKKPWTDEEDMIIVEKYKLYGPHWVKISHFLPGRSGNNIKNRWHNALTKFHGIQHKNPRQERRSKKEKWIEENVQQPQCEVIHTAVDQSYQKSYDNLTDLFQHFDESLFNDFGEFQIF